MRAERTGFAILELIVALTLLATTGTGLLALLSQSRMTLERVRIAEERVTRAEQLLAGIAREPRAMLMAKSGRRRVAGLELRVVRASRDLFDIAVADTASRAVLVATTVFRPAEKPDAP